MIPIRMKICIYTLTAGVIIFAGTASAQRYKSIADTAKLNKEYNQTTKDIADLNTKLTAYNNKTAGYQDKASSSQQAAMSADQASKEQASAAAGGNIKDVKKELRKAKEANNDANDARDAASNEKANQKEINKLTEQISKKNKKLADLDQQRTAILSQTTAAPVQQ